MNRKEAIKALLAKERYDFQDLADIVSLLRAENGCPWDREQTHKSIRSCMIEEAYEVVEAIDTENSVLLREELGDVLFQVLFHSQLEAEQGRFTVEDVVHDICLKMIRRHLHVFAECDVTGADDALGRWEESKIEEKQRTTLSSRLRAVPPMLPALMRASKIAKKAGTLEGQTVQSLAKEVKARADAIAVQNGNVTPEQLGALLFSAAGLSVCAQLDAEQALGQAVDSVILQAERLENAENDEKNENT